MFGKLGLYAAAAFIGLSTAAVAAPLAPQVDFRSSTFSAANNQHSFYANIDGIGMTIQAYSVDDSGNRVQASLWWDSQDGLGVRGGKENDEIDAGESILITFDETIGLSHVFLSDLFMNESYAGGRFDESGWYEVDGEAVEFDAADLSDTDGDKTNGEHVLELSKIIPVNQLAFFAPKHSGGHDYSLIGFTDPPIPGAELQQVPVPPMLALSLLAFGLIARRKIVNRA